jgi:hypothetical protein
MDLIHRRPDVGVGFAIAWDDAQARNGDAFEAAWAADMARSTQAAGQRSNR